MNIVALCCVENDTVYNNYLRPSCESHNIQCIPVKDDPSSPIKCSVEQKFKVTALKIVKENPFSDNDVIIFAKETVLILDKDFRQKIEILFNTKEFLDVALLGVAGVLSIDKKPFFTNDCFGRLMVPTPSNPECGDVLEFNHVGCSTDIVTVYGSIFAMRVKALREQFMFDDESFKNSEFSLLDLCVRLRQSNYKVCVSDVLVYDASEDIFKDPPNNQIFNESNYLEMLQAFENKHKLQFPISKDSFETVKVVVNENDLL